MPGETRAYYVPLTDEEIEAIHREQKLSGRDYKAEIRALISEAVARRDELRAWSTPDPTTEQGGNDGTSLAD